MRIVTTIPLIFGAVHPIVLGCYVFVMLVGLGGWLLLNKATDSFQSPSFLTVVPVVLIGYLILQSIPIPLDWLALLSPERAHASADGQYSGRCWIAAHFLK